MAKAGVLTIDVNAGTAQFIVDMDRAAGKLRNLGAGAQESGGHLVSSMQSSSAAIRLLENPLGNNIRAVERFITLLPGVGKLLQAAFPVVGAVALGSVIAKLGSEAYKFYESIQQAPTRIATAFRELNNPLQLTTDELALANDRLRNDIAKLEGKPKNGLAEALDEARVVADRLADSLDKDLGALEKLLKEQGAGAFKSLLTGSRPTAGDDEGIERLRVQVATARYMARQNSDNATTPEGKAKALLAGELEQRRLINEEIARQKKLIEDATALQEQRRSRRGDQQLGSSSGPIPADQTNFIATHKQTVSNLGEASDEVQERIDNASLTTKKAQLTDSKENAEAVKRKGREAAQAQREADEELLATMEADHQMLLSETIAFWESRRKLDSDNLSYQGEITKTLGHLYQEADRQVAEQQKKSVEEQKAFMEKAYAAMVELRKRAIEESREQTKQILDPGEGANLLKRKPEDLNGVVGDEARLNKAGFPGVSRQEGAITQQQQGLAAMVAMNAPIGQQLAMREKILEAQIALGIEEDKDVSRQQLELETLKAKQTLMQWENVNLGAAAKGDLLNTAMTLPGALGGAVSSGIFGGKKGEDVGKQVGDALKNAGKQLFGQLLTQSIEKLIGVTILHTAATTAGTSATLSSTVATIGHTIATDAQIIATNLNTWWLAIKSFLGFAGGGRPQPGVPYWVGEHGPELRVDDGPGMIVPHDASMDFVKRAGSRPGPTSTGYSSSTHHYGNHTFNIYESSDARETARHITAMLRTTIPGGAVLSNG